MRILQVNKKFPYPLHDGESIAVTSIAKGLSEAGALVDLFALNTLKHYYAYDKARVPEELRHYEHIMTATVDTSVSYLKLILDMPTRKCYQVNRFYDRGVARALEDQLGQQSYDVYQMESLFVTPYLPVFRSYGTGLLVYRAHNLEFEIWSQLARFAGSLRSKVLERLAQKLKGYEARIINTFDLVLATSEADRQKMIDLGCYKPVITIPIGMAPILRNVKPVHTSGRTFTLGFLGSMDWLPNYHGINWFINEVFPGLIRRIPTVRLLVAGRGGHKLQHVTYKGILWLGEVEDSRSFLHQVDALIVPLFAGSGTRVKILEALSMGIPVISTSLGAAGLSLTEESQWLKAETGDEFVLQVRRLVQDQDLRSKLTNEGPKWIAANHDTGTIGGKLYSKYYKMLSPE